MDVQHILESSLSLLMRECSAYFHLLCCMLFLLQSCCGKWICCFLSQQSGSRVYGLLSVSLFPDFYGTVSWQKNEVSVFTGNNNHRKYL